MAPADIALWLDGGPVPGAAAAGVRLAAPEEHAQAVASPWVRRLRDEGLRDPGLAYLMILFDGVERAGGGDVPVELSVPPDVASDARGIVAFAQDALASTLAPDLVIGVPPTEPGAAALEELTARGIATAADGVLSLECHARVAGAYTRGLERRAAGGLPVDAVMSVAWLPAGLLDDAADAALGDGSELRGTVAAAVGQAVYLQARRRFSGPAWRRLAARGARPQRVGFRDLRAGCSQRNVERLALPGCALALDPAAPALPLAPGEPDETEVAWVLLEAAAAGLALPSLASALNAGLRERRAAAYRALLDRLAAELRGEDSVARAGC